MRYLLISMFTLLCLLNSFAKITQELELQLMKTSASEMVPCVVLMNTSYPYSDFKGVTAESRINAYKEVAHASQRELLQSLSQKSKDATVCRTFWVINGISIKAKKRMIYELAQRPDIKEISFNPIYKIETPIGSDKSAISRGIAWGVKAVCADKCWTTGVTGEGVIVGIIDSGVDFDHPALKDKWSGHWYVASDLPQNANPYDDEGHGTHCTGSILGGDGTGTFAEDVGVAPGAKIAVAKALDEKNAGSDTRFIECLEFMANLKSTVDIKALSCSWGRSGGGYTLWYDACKALWSLDVILIFANGNSGSRGLGSVATPADYPIVIGVGATDINDKIAELSSRGPAPEKEPYTDKSMWFRDDWNLLKPDISAPGIKVYSCKREGGYTELSGTSMAAPHVCGVIALMFQKNNDLTPEMVYNLLIDNADQPPYPESYPNNYFGYGRINAFRVVNATPPASQPYLHIMNVAMNALKPGETQDMTLTLKNIGTLDATGAKGTLIALDNFIAVQNAGYSFGNLKPNDQASNSAAPFKVIAHASTPQGHRATMGLVLDMSKSYRGQKAHVDTLVFNITIGTAPAPFTIFADDFEYSGGGSFANNWNTSGNWARVSHFSRSTSHSVTSGDHTSSNAIILKNPLDLSSYSNPRLSFFKADSCGWPGLWRTVTVSASTDGGSSWNTLFHFNGASDSQIGKWRLQDIPLAAYCQKNVTFKVSYTQSTGTDEVRFYIDDFSITEPFDNAPPYFSQTTLWKETHLTGPFDVNATITDAHGVNSAILFYRVNNGSWTSVPMSNQGGGEAYKGVIPSQGNNGTIDYYLEATDKWSGGPANKGAFPVGASQSSGYHTFKYGSSNILNKINLVSFSLHCSQLANGMLNIQYSLPTAMKVKLRMFNVNGREVALLKDRHQKRGVYKINWRSQEGTTSRNASGLYLIHFEGNPPHEISADQSFKKVVGVLMIN